MESFIINNYINLIWDYHQLYNKPEKADCIFTLGSNDQRIAEYASNLYLDGFAPYLIFSGGIAHSGDLLSTGWDKSEAEIFADVAINMGVPKDKIIIEKQAKNTGENVLFTEKILKEKNIKFDKIIAVQKPYMERRTYATIKVHWPHKNVIVTSPNISLEEYPTSNIKKGDVINIMVGDLQRIMDYPALGYQIKQEVPDNVKHAYKKLVEFGFDKHLIH
ncbi:MAG: YdcF family protein [Spirochaetaceae bacterium]